MAKVKDEANDLEDLMSYINQDSGVSQNNKKQKIPNIKMDSSIGEEFVSNSSLLVDMKLEKRKMERKARITIKEMSKHILTRKNYQEAYVSNKIEQDVITLSGLYWQYECTELIQNSVMQEIGHGMNSPRMYEVFGELCDRLQNLNKQIVETERVLRKTYIDLKIESETKQSDEEHTLELENSGISAPKLLSSKDIISQMKEDYQDSMKDVLKEQIKAEKKEEKIEIEKEKTVEKNIDYLST